MGKLSPRRQAFINALVARKTYAEAYAEAYPKSAKSSRKVLETRARRLLEVPEVIECYREMLEAYQAQERERVGCQREDIISDYVYLVNKIKGEIERRERALELEAELLRKSSALDEEEAQLEAARVLQRAVLSSALTGGFVQAMQGLAKMLGYENAPVEVEEGVYFEGEDEL